MGIFFEAKGSEKAKSKRRRKGKRQKAEVGGLKAD
jgi:hypothetical protein